MDLLAGDRQYPNSDDFPQHIAPFPDLLNPSSSAAADSALPPQKLRPIRCGAAGVIPGAFEVEVGFLSNDPCEVNRDGSEYFESAPKEGAPRFGSGSEWSRVVKRRVLESGSSSSSGGCDDSSAIAKEPGIRKRKRKSRKNKKLETFIESLVMKVMEKQEQMHIQLVETLEKRERERVISEEAWKRQEMERTKRDEELRMQETSRSIALISFIHNILGHENETPQPISSYDPNDDTPQPFMASCWEQGGDTTGIQKDINTMHDEASNRRWPDAEVQALIALRTALEHKIRVMGLKSSIWEEISVGMQDMGYSRTAKKCKEKWENINKYFKRAVGSGKKPVSSPHYRELNDLYKNGVVDLGNGSKACK